MKKNSLFNNMNLIVTMVAIVSLSGCVLNDMTDLENQITEIMARPGGRIEPLPEIKPYEAYTYKSGQLNKKDPFAPFFEVPKPTVEDAMAADDGLTEEMKREISFRNKEELEKFELDSLRMVGTMDNEDNKWAIVLDPQGTVHRVKVGEYMGMNIGKVTNIFEEKIQLREIFQAINGRWEEQEASLVLVEEE